MSTSAGRLSKQDAPLLNLRVVPGRPDLDNQTVAGLSPVDAESIGVTDGDAIRIETVGGRTAYATITKDAGAAEPGTIALGTMLRRGLHARAHTAVAIYAVSVGECAEVALVPWIDTTSFPGLQGHLERCLATSRFLAAEGMLVYAPLPDSAAGSWYTVAAVKPDGAGYIGTSTRIRFERDSQAHEQAMAPGFDDVGGLDETITLVRELVELPLLHPHVYHRLGISAPRGIIFEGPPGTGKTHLARAMVNALKASFFYIEGPALVGSYHGETEGNIRRLFHDAVHEAPAVILIDELDALLPRRDRAGTFSDTRMVTQLLALMDGLKGVDQVVVIGTTNRVDAIDLAARRPGRFDREVYFPPPDRKGRLAILQIHTRDMPLTMEAEASLEALVDRTDGFVGSDLLELARVAGLNALRTAVGPVDPRSRLDAPNVESHLGEVVVRPEDFDAALHEVTPSLLRGTRVEAPVTKWDDIGGLDDVKETLQQYVEEPLRQRRDLSQVPRGIVLYGPPGTGKTLLVRALASAAGVNLVVLEGVKVFSRWLGESEDAVHQVFATARHVSPCIVFLEQLDALAPEREPGEGARAAERVVAQLQVELDGLARLEDIVVVAETNRLDAVDAAILRAGRLGVHLAVDLPGHDDRLAICAVISRQMGLEEVLTGEVRGRLAAVTEGFSGADLAQVLREVAVGERLTAGSGMEALMKAAVDRRRRSLMTLQHLPEDP